MEELYAMQNTKQIIQNTANMLGNLQQKFSQSMIYNIVDSGLEIGIRVLCPDIIEDNVIDIKDSIMENGISGGIEKIINDINNFGKNTYGIVTGNFSDVSQLESAIKTGGTLDTISKLLDKGIDVANSIGIINKDIKKNLKMGKKILIENIDNKLSEELKEQKGYLKEVNKYIDKWQKYFEKEDFEKMENIFNELTSYIEKTIPFESTISSYKKIETLQNLIKNNNQSFDLSEEELELVEALSN